MKNNIARGMPNPQSLSSYIDQKRLWSRHLALGKIGKTGNGGVNRQALSAVDGRAHQQVITWAETIGATASVDSIGNLFLRLDGSNPELSPMITGSHLDTQPNGGFFDGAYGVLAGLEALEAIVESGTVLMRPIELVIWQNEEGCRFSPGTMGSGVYVGALDLGEMLQVRDGNNVSVNEALQMITKDLGLTIEPDRVHDCHAYIEAHIEQGPVLEESNTIIGAVSGIQGMRQYRISVKGQSAHAGTTPRSKRKDAVIAATQMIAELEEATQDKSDILRFTVGRIDVWPNSVNTIAERAVFTIDVRHPDEDCLEDIEEKIRDAAQSSTTCEIEIEHLIKVPSIQFDRSLVEATVNAARALGFPSRRLVSGATHDARFMATLFPASMIFVPCKNGISHNENEWAEPEHLWSGACVLAKLIQAMCCEDQTAPLPVTSSRRPEAKRRYHD